MRFLWTLGALGYLSGCTGVFTVKPQDETGISRANERPTASDLLLETDEDTPLSFRLAGYDADLDPLTYRHTDPDPAAGTLSGTPPDLSFVPAPDFSSADPVTFTYTVSDGSKESLPATVSIFVKNVNDVPVATDLDVTTQEEVDTEITLVATDVEDDAAGVALVYDLQNDPAFGTLDTMALPLVVYRSNDDFSGVDTFTYFVTDSSGARSGYATVRITVTDVNDAPVPGADSYVMDEDTVLTRTAAAGLLANDTNLEDDTLEVASITPPDSGTVVVNADGSFTYTPEADYSGTVSFSYLLTDGTETLAEATPVTIEVESVPDVPRIVDEPSYAVVEDTPFVADVLDDCSSANAGLLCAVVDPDEGDELAVSLIDLEEPDHAVDFEVNADGTFTYQPEENYTGFDSFSYRVIDSGFLVSDIITVTLSVSPQNDQPVSAPDSYTVDEDGTLLVGLGTGLLLNDSDVDGDELFVVVPVTSLPVNGLLLTLNDEDGTFVYQPDEDFNGTDSFTYQVSDGNGGLDTATVTVTINDADSPATSIELEVTGPEVYRFFNTQSGTHFYSRDEFEANSILTNLPHFRLEGPAFKAADPSNGPTADVFRFFNTGNGAHLFTQDTDERDFVIANLDHFNFEGVAYQGHPVPVEGSVPLYRFFNTQTGGHFYTVNESEKDNIIDTMSDVYNFERTAYHVYRPTDIEIAPVQSDPVSIVGTTLALEADFGLF